MKTSLVSLIVILLFVTTSFAADFAPSVMSISAPTIIHYEFKGLNLKIPVSITGAPANLIFCVLTKDQGATIGHVLNGYLGWHEVNKIDTCIYISDIQQLDIGNNDVIWSGKNQDGNAVYAGEYYYYLWGFNNVNNKTIVSEVLSLSDTGKFITHDHTGAPYEQPIIYSQQHSGNDEHMWYRSKWIVGNDPEDAGLIETTAYPIISGGRAQLVPDPYESDKFFVLNVDDNVVAHIRKYKWTPNGESVLQNGWGENGEFTYTVFTNPGDGRNWEAMAYVGNDVLVSTNNDVYGGQLENELLLIDIIEGTEIKRIDLSDWWVNIADGEGGGQANSGPNDFDVRKGLLFMGSHTTCTNQVIDPLAGEDAEDFNVWVNKNGDYVGDHNFEEDSNKPWMCNDYNVGPYKYNISSDENLFSVFPSFDMGAVSFGLYAPDGSGIGYFAYAGETAGGKNYSFFVQYSSAYDGLYSDNAGSTGGWDVPGIWYVAHDSFKGVITNQVVVDEAGPSAFAVAQNTPNPFNPTTTINFSIPEADNVSIDVFNVAGQKVETIASGFMNAGSHSVVWEASGFTSGVYFYTIRTGGFSKTMKMTLLK